MTGQLEEEMLRVRERLHDLGTLLNQVSLQMATFAHTDEQLRSIQSTIKSLTDSVNSNSTDMLQRITSTERWQEAHERLDEERWKNLEKTLGEIKGMLETVPVKMEEDFAADRKKLEALDSAFKEMQGGFKAMRWIGGLVGFGIMLLEALHVWGGK